MTWEAKAQSVTPVFNQCTLTERQTIHSAETRGNWEKHGTVLSFRCRQRREEKNYWTNNAHQRNAGQMPTIVLAAVKNNYNVKKEDKANIAISSGFNVLRMNFLEIPA